MDFPNIKDIRYLIGKDGNAWYAVKSDFYDIQVSPCGFAATPEEAMDQLKSELCGEWE